MFVDQVRTSTTPIRISGSREGAVNHFIIQKKIK